MTEIKKCGLPQLKILQNLCRTTFKETFTSGNTKEDMEKHLDTAYSDDKLKRQLESPDSVTYIAYCDGVPSGYVQLNKGEMQAEKGYNGSLEIQRIYVLQAAKGKGVGTRFMKIAEQTAKEWGLDYIWLGVWEHNEAAIGFYKSKGFEELSEHIFIVGDDRQRDIIMKKSIK